MSFPPFAVTVDLVLMTILQDQLAVLLQQRCDEPYLDALALPGGFVGIDETLDAAAHRVLIDKAGFTAGDGGWLEQLYTFGDPARDPRMRTISIAYFALMPHEKLAQAVNLRADLCLKPALNTVVPLAFDHGSIVETALTRLKGKLDHTPIAFALLPELFTLRDLQRVHEIVTGTALNKPAFRRRMLDKGWLEPTGQRETETKFRPAELYRHSSD